MIELKTTIKLDIITTTCNDITESLTKKILGVKQFSEMLENSKFENKKQIIGNLHQISMYLLECKENLIKFGVRIKNE